MKPQAIIVQLQRNKLVFQNLLESTSQKLRLFKPYADTWCLLEVVCHLLDEEREDFKARVQSILTDPNEPLKPISPEKWPTERRYLDQDFETVLEEFLSERERSIEWLQSLQNPEWEQTVDHPEVGPRSAKKFLVNWLAHDYHHIRQINRIHHAYLKACSADDLTYAGKW